MKKTNAISLLIQQTLLAMQHSTYSKRSIAEYDKYGFSLILSYFMQRDENNYSETLLDEFIQECIALYNNKELGRTIYQKSRKSAFLLKEYLETGKIIWQRIPSQKTRMLSTDFQKHLDLFCREKTKDGTLIESTMKTYRSAIRQFLFLLEKRNMANFSKITLQIVSEVLTDFAKQYPAGTKSSIPSVRLFLKFLYEIGSVSVDLQKAIPEFATTRSAIRLGFSSQEIEKILLLPDTNTKIGKRDFAIFTLATQTGLRSVDIAYLKFSSIDWKKLKIHITQHKTGKPLSLPLPIESANALASYILQARFDCDSPFVFLCDNLPLRSLEPRSLSTILTRYLTKYDLHNPLVPRRGMHSFRRAFGPRLLSSEIPLAFLSELLGHSHIDSTKPYVGTDEVGLRKCGLSLSGIEVEEGALQ